jgi:hypothetical protein
MSVLPAFWKRSMRVLFTDLDLSTMVSVPTSTRPTSFGSMLYFSSSDCTAVVWRFGDKKVRSA